MNALLQQLFMQPGLRRDILQIKFPDIHDEKEDEVLSNPESTDEQRADALKKRQKWIYDREVVVRFQYLMAYLQESDKQYYDPTVFCKAFKDWSGVSVNVSVQMDTNEFLNMMFDKIDTIVKKTSYKDVLKDHMGGKLSHELIAKDGNTTLYSEREEDFYYLTIRIKEKKNIQEGLAEFIEQQDVAYTWGKFGQKDKTVKRASVKKLPPCLCIHLARFEFDFDAMKRVKVNDKVEFPEILNMKPYTKEGLFERDKVRGLKTKWDMDATVTEDPTESKDSDTKEDPEGMPKRTEKMPSYQDSHYLYRLVGVLVHMGSTDAGHYYSFIKERSSEGRWLQFNDTLVTQFNPERIGDECFGGERLVRIQKYMTHEMQAKPNSGYMIFYERVEQTPDSPDASRQSSVGSQSSNHSPHKVPRTNSVTSSVMLARARADARVTVPPKIYDKIWEENIAYWKDKWVFDTEYADFFIRVYENNESAANYNVALPAADDLTGKLNEACVRFTLLTLARSQMREKFDRYVDLLCQRLPEHKPSCCWLLDTLCKESWAEDLLLMCHKENVWRGAARVICTALDAVCQSEYVEQEDPDAEPPSVSTQYMIVNHDELDAKITTPEDLKVTQAFSQHFSYIRQKHGIRLSDQTPDGSESKEPERPTSPTVPPRPRTEKFSVDFVATMIDLLPQAQTQWKRMDQYFKVLQTFARKSPEMAQHLVRNGFTEMLLDFFLNRDSPCPSEGILGAAKARPQIGDAFTTPDWGHFLALLAALITNQTTPTLGKHVQMASQPNRRDSAQLVQHTKATEEMVLGKAFIERIICEATTKRRARDVGHIVCHWAFENSMFTDDVVSYVCQGIEKKDGDDLRSYFYLLEQLIVLEDSLSTSRTDTILSNTLAMMKETKNYWQATSVNIECMCRLAGKIPEVGDWLRRNHDSTDVDWMVPWCFNNHINMEMNVRRWKPVERDVYDTDGDVSGGNAGYMSRSYGSANQLRMVNDEKGKFLKLLFENSHKPELMAEVVQCQYMTYHTGQNLRCRDNFGKVRRCLVLAVDDNKIKIRFNGNNNTVEHPRNRNVQWIDIFSNRVIRTSTPATNIMVSRNYHNIDSDDDSADNIQS